MNREKVPNGLYACPCCGYATIFEPECYEICEICFWEDDGQDDPAQNECFGGPNHVSLTEARRNYLVFGAAELKDLSKVRNPKHEDVKLRNYSLQYSIIKT